MNGTGAGRCGGAGIRIELKSWGSATCPQNFPRESLPHRRWDQLETPVSQPERRAEPLQLGVLERRQRPVPRAPRGGRQAGRGQCGDRVRRRVAETQRDCRQPAGVPFQNQLVSALWRLWKDSSKSLPVARPAVAERDDLVRLVVRGANNNSRDELKFFPALSELFGFGPPSHPMTPPDRRQAEQREARGAACAGRPPQHPGPSAHQAHRAHVTAGPALRGRAARAAGPRGPPNRPRTCGAARSSRPGARPRPPRTRTPGGRA